MVCEVKENSIKHLEREKATNSERKIIDTAKFNELNGSLTKLAVDKYGLETNGQMLFSNIQIKAEPNDSLFEKLQELKVRHDQRQAIADNAIVPKEDYDNDVQELFNSNPELAKIGTPQQYTEYIKTIFPDSKVKDIVYHGTDVEFEKFMSEYLGVNTKASDTDRGFAFSNNKNVAKTYGKNIKSVIINAQHIENVPPVSEQYDDILKPEFLSLKEQITSLKKIIAEQEKINSINTVDQLPNSFYVYSEKIKSFVKIVKENGSFYAYINNEKINDKLNNKQVLSLFETTKKNTKDLVNQLNLLTDENTAFIYKDIIDNRNIESTVRTNVYFAKPNQIYTLGSKQDIEGFKQFVKGVSKQAMFMKTPEVGYSLKLVTALMNLSSPKETKRTRKYGEQTKPERLTIRLNTKEKPYLEDNIRKTLNNKGVTNQQVDFVFDYMKSNNIQEISTSDLAAAIAATYSYTIEINIATEPIESANVGYDRFTLNGNNYSKIDTYRKNGNVITKEEYNLATEAYKKTENLGERNTGYYSNLTVPGGTNYTEQEIATPAITPSIKGHAQFATDKGIGWFRSDDQISEQVQGDVDYETYGVESGVAGDEIPGTRITKIVPKDKFTYNNDTYEKREPLFDEEDYGSISYTKNGKTITGNEFYKAFDAVNQPTKTRRILEVQSDLFQKGRNKKDLVKDDFKYLIGKSFLNSKGQKVIIESGGYTTDTNKPYLNIIVSGEIKAYSFEQIKNNPNISKLLEDFDYNNFGGSNQFLQLLNKDNNWVTFFVKSIIQDSAKQGYEKILFPTGNTASKIEGHTTLEEFKKEKEDRIKKLEENNKNGITKDSVFWKGVFIMKTQSNNGTLREGYAIWKSNINDLTDKSILTTEEAQNKHGVEFVYVNPSKEVLDSFKFNNEISQLKQELKRVETEGFGAFKPIYNFYENTVTNILKKQGYTPKQITDEFGNTWNEIEIKPERDTQSIAFMRMDQNNNIPIIPIDINTINQQASKAVAEAIASKLAAKLGVNYHNLTPEQATEMLKNNPVPYRGEPAFFYNGAVFIVGDNVKPGILLHEFSHPLLQGIRKTNPKLFNSLYEQLVKTEEGLGIIEYVKKAYPELAVDSDLFKEEALAFALQLKSLNNLEQQVETEGFQSFITKLLASLKQLLRDVFGTGVSLKNLNESTTLDELAEMLLDDTMFDFSELKLTEDDLVMYVRDIFGEANKLSASVKAESLQNIVNEFYATHVAIGNQIKDFKADKVTRDMLLRTLDKQGSSEFLTSVRKILAGYQNITNLQEVVNEDLEDLERTKQMAGALINSIDRVNTSSENIIRELNNITKQPDIINNRNTIALLGVYKNTSQTWLDLVDEINQALDELDIDKNSEFYTLITSIVNNSTIINSKIADIYKKGNIQFFVEITGYMNEFVNKELKGNLGIAFKNAFPEDQLEAAVDDFYNKVIQQRVSNDDLQKLYTKGVPANILKDFIDKYNNYVVNEDKIKDALTGHAKDVSWFNRWLESYSSSNDVIVGPLAMFIQNQRTEVETRVWKASQEFRSKLATLLPKVNFNKLNQSQIINMVAGKDKIFYFNKETKTYEAKEIWTFLNEFGNGWRFELDKLEYEYEEAKKSGDKDEIAKTLDALRQFNKDYMWQEYTLDFYEKDDMFKNSEIGSLAYAARRSALDNYLNLQNSLQKEYERFERYSELQEAFRSYQRLYSLQYEDGSEKVDDPAKGIYDKSIAELLIKHRQETNKFYEWVPITNSLDTAYNEFITELQTKNIQKGTKEYETKLREWQKQNIRVVYSEKYYQTRTELFEKLKSIQDQINTQLGSTYNISDEYKKILDMLFMYKDDFGQPDATQLGDDKLKKIKDIQQDIINFRQKFDKYTGLTREDSQTLSELVLKSRDEELTDEEAEELDRLISSKKNVDVNLIETLSEVLEELSNISSKYPTDYYMEALETRLSSYANIPVFTDVTVDNFINSELFQQLIDPTSDLYDEDLAKWFELNHVEAKVYENKELVTKFQRTAANSYSKPTNPEHFISTKIKDNQTNEVISIIGVPNIRHSRRVVKNEYRTIPRGVSKKDYVGTYIDNKGNFLPRSFQPGNKNSAVSDRFIDKRYQALKANPNSPEFELLEAMKKYHLLNQEGASGYGKLYLDVPRYGIGSNDKYQLLAKGEYGERFKDIRSNVGEWLKQKFGKSVQDNLNGFNYNPENNLVNTDLKGNEVSYIPVTGIYNLDINTVDADVFNSLFKYTLSIQTQTALLKSLPLVESILDTLDDPANQPKNLDAFSKGIYALRKKQQHPTRKNATNNRAAQVRSLVEREYQGRQVTGIEENHPVLSKWLSNITSMSSRAALALNIPSDLKNQFSGYVQTIIEASGNRYISPRDLALSATWATKAMLEWTTKGIYEVGPGAISTQLIQIFDPTFKANDENGRPVYRSLYKDLINGEWMYMHRKFGEMDVAMRLFGSFLHAEKVEQTFSDGKKTLIRYNDAWEKDAEGILKLKEGIHPGWNYESIFHTYAKGESLESIAKKYNISVDELKAKNRIKSEIQLEDGQEIVISKSEYFKQFKNKLQGTSRALFGVYDEFGQPEGNKLILYRMFFFMRKWFTPMFVNRFGMDLSKENFGGARYDWAMGRTTKGYYVEAFQALYKIIKSKGADYQFMTDDQKGAMKKLSAEGLVMITTSLLASMLFGFDDDDPDKWKKIKAKSGALFTDEFNTYGFISNHALLLLLGVQAETGAFIPLPSIGGMNFGADDYAKLMTSTTTAFGNTLLTYIEIFGDILNLATFNDEAVRYKKDVGPYWWQKKGELKTYKRIFNMLGLTGGIGDPETPLKNLQKGSTRIR